MKKIYKTIIALVMSVVAMSSVVACSGRDDDIETIDSSKTQLEISNFNGGFGGEWLEIAKARFEELYKDTSFEEGKVGVQVRITPTKDQGTALADLMSTSGMHIYFTQGIDYYDCVNRGLLADITDVVTGSLSDYGENKTIESKFNDQQKSFLKTSENKYYGIPHYASYDGIQYDVDLFEEKGFYFAADPNVDANTTKYNTWLDNGNNGFIMDKTDTRSNGPDGKPNTSDDGLPATYEEFYKLLDYIVDGGCTPFVWTGQFRSDYIKGLISSLAVDYEGYDQMMLNYTFNGTATHLVKSIDDNGNVTFEEPTQIDNTNGYMMLKSAGRYYGMSFYQQITSKSTYYNSSCFNETVSHLGAQQEFLFSRPEAKKPIAMLAEGSYWVNESKDTFATIAAQYDEEYSIMNRKLGMMPLPKVSEKQIGEGQTVQDGLSSYCLINATCTGVHLDLAKKFLKFVNTDESLREFTVTTNSPKSLNYDLTESDLEKLSYYGKCIWNIKETSDVVYPVSTNSIFMSNSHALMYTMLIDVEQYDPAADWLRGTNSSASKLSASDYFFKLQNQYGETWWKGLNSVS